MEDLPPHLVAEIKRGNVVAFVGAGFAGPARLPTWGALLEGILTSARSLGRLVGVEGGEDAFVAHVKEQIDRRTAEGYDRAAQVMADVVGTTELPACGCQLTAAPACQHRRFASTRRSSRGSIPLCLAICATLVVGLYALPPLSTRVSASPIVRSPPPAAVDVISHGVSSAGGRWEPSAWYHEAAPHYITAQPVAVAVALVGRASAIDILCVIDGRSVWRAGPETAVPFGSPLSCAFDGAIGNCTCALDDRFAAGVHTVALYVVDAAKRVSLLGDVILVDLQGEPSADDGGLARLRRHEALMASAQVGASVGIYYTSYQQVMAQVYQNISLLLNHTAWTVEDVLRSNGTLALADSIWRWETQAASPPWSSQRLGVMQHAPALGYYCYYRKRANESVGYIPDCPEADSVLSTHAAELSSAGFTFVTMDATNWDRDPFNASTGSDLYQLRPTEVLAEVWSGMRLRGMATPQLGLFDQVTSDCSAPATCLWDVYLERIYNNATLLEAGLVWSRNVSSGAGSNAAAAATQLLWMVVNTPSLSEGAVEAIESNGGAGNIVTFLNWVAGGPYESYYDSGVWTYFAPCVRTAADGTLAFSNDAPIELDAPCGHFKTRGSAVGDSWTVSAAIAMANAPFGTTTKLNGLYLKQQWWDVLTDASPTAYIFAPSWNEFDVGALDMAGWDISNPHFYSVGLDSADPDRYTWFLDGWGAERSRTIEPSVVDGGYYYDLFASCTRVYRVQTAMGLAGACVVSGEECCSVHANQVFSRIWSLSRASGAAAEVADTLLTNDDEERAALLASGAWVENAAPFAMLANGGPTGFAVNSSVPWLAANASDAYWRAAVTPFIIFGNETGASVNGTVPLWRCVVGAGDAARHYIAASSACDGLGGAPDRLLGYAGLGRESLMIREVRRCYSAGGLWYPAVNSICAAGDVDQGVQGYAV